MSSYVCNFCFTTFNSQSSLKYHKETAKYCLKIQEKDGNTEYYHYKCNSCDKSFLAKRHLDKHQESCSTKINEENKEKDEEIMRYRILLEHKERELHEYKSNKEREFQEYKIEKEKQIKKLEDMLEKANDTIADIAKQPKTTNTTNIRGNQNIQNILSDYKTYEEYTDHERIISVANQQDMEKYFWKGQEGIAKFCVDHIAKTSDGKMIICCTDPSRKRYKYPSKNNQLAEDIDVRQFTEKIAKPIKEVCEVVYNNIQKDIEEKMQSDQKEYDSSFLQTKKGIAIERYVQINNIDDNEYNNSYRKEMCILLSSHTTPDEKK